LRNEVREVHKEVKEVKEYVAKGRMEGNAKKETEGIKKK
jgi:hypothetical protein